MERKDETYPVASWGAAARGDLAHAGMTSRDIVASEAAGTRAVATSDRLPLDGSSTTTEQAVLQVLGFTLGDPLDPLFRQATLPAGWRKQPSPEDDRTTVLLDAQGRARGYIWYKAAWYDQAAHLTLRRRYELAEWPGPTTTAKDWESAIRRWVITDADRVIWAGEPYTRPGDGAEASAFRTYRQTQETRRAEARAELAARFPEWQSPAAYWEATR